MFEPEASDDDAPPSLVGTALVFAVPLALAAVWGGWDATHRSVIGDAGPWRTSAALAVVIAPLLGFAFVRQRYESVENAVDTLGRAKAILLGAVVAALAYVPTALGLAAVANALNAAGLDTREETITCTVGSIWHRTRADKDLGWQMSYWCDVRGEHLAASLERLPARPNLVEGGSVHVRAARGRLGYWIRLSDPTDAATVRAP